LEDEIMATKTKARKSAKGPVATVRSEDTNYRAAKIYRSPKAVPLQELPAEYVRADLEFIGVEHAGASYEARVYVNNPTADVNTEPNEGNGYAGSFYVFGHGGCFGDPGHCDVHERPRDAFDPRRSHPLEPMKKVVVATEAIKAAAMTGSPLKVTVVPVVTSWSEKVETDDVLKFDHINLVTYF
jgi:tyrosinase